MRCPPAGPVCDDATMSTSPAASPVLTLVHGRQPETELEVKRSRFLARAARTDTEAEARAFVAEVRGEHPTARHHCSAFVVGVPGALPVERSNDDGEPSGSAGQPILEVLRGTGLVGVSVVVTRYFGGTLLGTGGLVRAYSQAAAQALDAARRARLVTRHLWDVRVPVAEAGRLEAELRALAGAREDSPDVEETVWGPTHAVLLLSTASAEAAALTETLAALSQGTAVPEAAGSRVIEQPC